MSQVNLYALVTTLAALAVAAVVLAGSMAYRGWERRAGRLGRLEDAMIGRQIDDLAAGVIAPEEATRILRDMRYLPGHGGTVPDGTRGAYRPSALHHAMSFPESANGSSRLGYRIFKWLLTLAIFLFLGLMVYAWWTYPTSAAATALLPTGSGLDDRLLAVRELRRDWLQQVKDLGQMFVLTPVLPLIAAVIGYLFGVRRSTPPAPVAVQEAAPETAAEVAASGEGTDAVAPVPAGYPASWDERSAGPPARPGRRPAAKAPAAPASDPVTVLAAAATPTDGGAGSATRSTSRSAAGAGAADAAVAGAAGVAGAGAAGVAGGKPARRLSAGRRMADSAGAPATE